MYVFVYALAILSGFPQYKKNQARQGTVDLVREILWKSNGNNWELCNWHVNQWGILIFFTTSILFRTKPNFSNFFFLVFSRPQFTTRHFPFGHIIHCHIPCFHFMLCVTTIIFNAQYINNLGTVFLPEVLFSLGSFGSSYLYVLYFCMSVFHVPTLHCKTFSEIKGIIFVTHCNFYIKI